MKQTFLFRSSLALAVSAVSAAFISSGSAATLSTSIVSTETDIVNTGGSLVSSANFGEGAVTINGIFHGAGSASATNFTSTLGFEGDFRNGQTGLGGNLETLFSGIGGANGFNMSISGLTIGQNYLYQTYWEGVPLQTLAVVIEGDSLNGVADQPTGVLISYEFTALDDTLNILVDRDDSSGGDPNNWLSGYSLQAIPASPAIPEPSTALLGALGALALLRRRRG